MNIEGFARRWFNRMFQPREVSIEGIRIRVPDLASARIRRAIYDGYYEAPELRLVKQHLQPDDRVMEIGAGIGLLSGFSAKMIGSERVFAFEANPALEIAIRENYALNHVAPTLGMALIGHGEGERDFFVGKNFWASSIYQKAEGARPIKVPILDFNTTLRSIDPTFLYIDIEGGEYDLIPGADFHNVRKLLIEIHDWALTEEQVASTIQKLEKHGFVLKGKGGSDDYYYERADS